MPLPKRKISRSRRDKRRTHKKLSSPMVAECSHCHQPKLPHKACPNCGYYNGRLVIVPRER
ncbi:MAG TPA: 50S ribosomal protein L32 [bacterium]|nr:50S ribosomal protein L32 [bacterium]